MVGRDNAAAAGAFFVAVVVTGRFGIAPVCAQDDARVTVDVQACVELASPEERLACFGAQVDRVLQEQAQAPPAPSSRAAVPEPASADTASSVAPSQPPPGPASTERAAYREAPIEFVSTVVAVRETVPNSYVITLENGQVWRQMRPKWYPLRPGQTVRVHSTGWGNSYRLTAEDAGSFIQVERVR
jgi:hypothetical protein